MNYNLRVFSTLPPTKQKNNNKFTLLNKFNNKSITESQKKDPNQTPKKPKLHKLKTNKEANFQPKKTQPLLS